jgi:Ser/Thr protein kinase RdoA (MazF antagonist)
MLKSPTIRHKTRFAIDYLCAQHHLGTVLEPPQSLSGGYLHEIWKVETQEGTFVIKKLNPAIMKKPGMTQRLEQAESIGAAFYEAGIPAVIPHKSDNSFMTKIDGVYFLLYPFVRGTLYDLKRVSLLQACHVARLLARMHRLHLPIQKEVELHYDIISKATWLELLTQCKAQNLPFSQNLEKMFPFLLHCNEQHAQHVDELNAHLVLGHRDLHPENILWEDMTTPHIIDWEYSGLVNPAHEIAGAALEWSGLIARQLNPECFNAFVSAYKKAGGMITLDPMKGFYTFLANNMLSWTEINVTRALGLNASSFEEQAFATRMIEEIITTFDYIQNHLSFIEKMLHKHLTPVSASRENAH